MRRRRSQSAKLALLALTLAVGGGLLAMHVIATASGELAGSATHTAHEAMDVADAMPSATLHAADRDGNSTHLDALLECVWVLVGSFVLVAVTVWAVRVRWPDHHLRKLVRRIACSVQRAPPASVRLSLVGTARC